MLYAAIGPVAGGFAVCLAKPAAKGRKRNDEGMKDGWNRGED
jgi:hypothetical protein